ncbi:reverse transcriptase domain-containing protein [Tanacetum coccineum]
MPFGLRNAGATYQRLVDRAFHEQIGRNLEVYVDELVIKSHTEDEIVRDIEETFRTLRKINMKLNPKKCNFGVEEGMFLGYQVNTKGIKICPDKVWIDALDSAAGGNFLDKMPQEGLAIIESKSKVRYSRSRANDSRVSTDAPLSNSSPSNNSFDMQQIAASLDR